MTTTELIKNLQNADLFDHNITQFSVLETHCSYVLLTGEYAYKIKKSVDFGFLNYSSLEKRQHYCREELRRNQLLAGEVYLDVMPIYGSSQQPSLKPAGEPIEYMVKMREFAQDNLLSHLQQQNKLNVRLIDNLAKNLVEFHQAAPDVPHENPIGSSAHAQQQALDNFTQAQPLLSQPDDLTELADIKQQTQTLYERIAPAIDLRKQQGFVRQCHGDVHLNNIVLINDEPIIFDCIDFNHDFCWTDTMADLAFITMDLDEVGEHALSWRLLNTYLGLSGDYQGLSVLPYFQAYRAMVRAKIALFTQMQSDDTQVRDNQYQRYKGCVAQAKRYLTPKPTRLIIMCGVSASGKSTLSKQLAPRLDLIRITSDYERKRAANIALETDCTATLNTGLYQASQTEHTYQALQQQATKVLASGYSVLIDATCLKQHQRERFITLAQQRSLPCAIIYCHAAQTQLHQWLAERRQVGSDASEATAEVLTAQLSEIEVPTSTQTVPCIEINTANSLDFGRIIASLQQTSPI
jgi:aminoglycoside phosphotransferase family enzyme/gluconate kinase